MATARKNLGQAALSSTTLTDVYTVPSATSAVVSSISVANRGNTATTYRLSHALAGAADATKQYFAYDEAIAANSSITRTFGICCAATDVIRAYAGNANLSVNLWGEETS